MSDQTKPSYHHGDLRAALLTAAEAELTESGPDGFSLRSCARRAGVSHAAPKHHFGSADGLLDALATLGFERLVEAMKCRMENLAATEKLQASGRGYVAFARDNPALFKLMFSARQSAFRSPEFRSAAVRAFDILRDNAVEAAGGHSPEEAALDIAASWSIVHGLAHLVIEAPPAIGALLGGDPSEEAIARVLRQPLPVTGG